MNTFEQVKIHWRQLRKDTYQFLDGMKEADLDLKLPFEKSQTIRYQLHCMCGAQESNISLIVEDKWNGYSNYIEGNFYYILPFQRKHHDDSEKQCY